MQKDSNSTAIWPVYKYVSKSFEGLVVIKSNSDILLDAKFTSLPNEKGTLC